MTKGKPYEQKYDEYTYSEFRKFSQDFSKSYKHQVEGCSFADNLRKNEYEFWSAIECPDWFDEIEVEYASDLPVMKFGSAFSTREGAAGAKHPMNLMNVNHQ